MVDLNGAAAARRAGYTEKSCRTTAVHILAEPEVQELLAAKMAERSQRTEVTQDWVLKEIKDIALAAKQSDDYSNALKGMELLGKHIGMFKTKVEHSGPDGGPIEQKTVIVDEKEVKAAIAKLNDEY